LITFGVGVALVVLPAYGLRPPPARVSALVRGDRTGSMHSSAPGSAALAAVRSAIDATRIAGWLNHRKRSPRVLTDLPDVVDLLALAIGGGLGLRLAVDAVCRSGDGPVVEALTDALERVDRGARLADELERAGATLGDPAGPLVAAMVASDRYGVALLPALERMSLELRHARRRRGEEAARRCSVRLVFPLVCCTLPAFFLLTVVPLLAGSLGALRW
jgi:Flp pilus assembly protein TadB